MMLLAARFYQTLKFIEEIAQQNTHSLKCEPNYGVTVQLENMRWKSEYSGLA